jgi:hypothetical protein
MKRILSIIIAGILAGVFAFTGLAPASASALHRTGSLHLTKECSQFHGQAGGFCTITTSNLKIIKPGSRVIYLKAAGLTGLDTNIVLDTGHGNKAFGHVVLDFSTGTGRVTLNGGTGKFEHFHARAAVTFIAGVDWAWNGTYHFNDD